MKGLNWYNYTRTKVNEALLIRFISNFLLKTFLSYLTFEYVVVQIFPWFNFFQTSLIIISLCLVFIIII